MNRDINNQLGNIAAENAVEVLWAIGLKSKLKSVFHASERQTKICSFHMAQYYHIY
jgi:hypothetical protein